MLFTPIFTNIHFKREYHSTFVHAHTLVSHCSPFFFSQSKLCDHINSKSASFVRWRLTLSRNQSILPFKWVSITNLIWNDIFPFISCLSRNFCYLFHIPRIHNLFQFFFRTFRSIALDHINIYIDSFPSLHHRKFHLSIELDVFFFCTFSLCIMRISFHSAINAMLISWYIWREKRILRLSHQNVTTWNMVTVSHSINSYCSITKHRKRDWFRFKINSDAFIISVTLYARRPN